MATIVLQVVGAAIGGAIGGPVGATIGRAVGAAAGYAIDQKIFTKDQVITGPRLDGSRFLSSSDGASIPRVYGRAQIGGQIIWATRFEEVRSQSKQGGKGGPTTKVTQFTYFANLAVGLCAGPLSRIGRIWADGSELDQTQIKIRYYLGAQDQQPDPMIEALQSPGNTPAYRGLAYVVFEDLPLAKYGNRIPQLTFEVIRSIGQLEQSVKSVCVIPGSTAFGYSPKKLTANDGSGNTVTHNRNALVAPSDWSASIDELQALCPNLETVSLVVAWFCDDLRAGNCQIMPGVEHPGINADGHAWQVSGVNAAAAHQISQIDGAPAFGSTPTDKSVIEAITDLHARGLKVTLYPFIMMDIASDNVLPDPQGETSQPPYPWRGQITCDPAIGQPASADQTAAAKIQITSFSGNAAPNDFSPATNTINFTGAFQWSFRRMVLHYAHLCVLAGGVENFVIGSEMKGLTSVRDDANAFPFADDLVALATDVNTILGPACKLTYAADWSEYFGYHPQDGSNDVYFNLDPLWVSSAIEGIGIDNYMPLADWRDSGDPGDLDAGEYDPEYFGKNISSGEGYDWFYATNSDRRSAMRTAITDGQGEPWVWRFKDLKSWWSNTHHERVNGVRSPTPTAWQPQSKPFWFTEIGCPAINKGANQPNVFHDDKSSVSAVPYFSSGHRDDLIQRNFLHAHLNHWSSGQNLDAVNPQSNVYSGRMVDNRQISLWAWDARPFPAFPMNTEIWSDRQNWTTGHWLNGRFGSCPVDDLIAAILQDYSFSQHRIDVLPGWVNGFVIPAQAPARQVLEPLMTLFGITAVSSAGQVKFQPGSGVAGAVVAINDLVENPDQPIVISRRAEVADLPAGAIVHHDELSASIQSVATKSRVIEGQSSRLIQMQLPAVLPSQFARSMADARIREAWIGREDLTIRLPAQMLQYMPGDIVEFDNQQYKGLWQIIEIEDGPERQLALRRVEKPTTLSFPAALPSGSAESNSGLGQPLALLLDIPRSQTAIAHSPKLVTAIAATPWAGSYTFASSPGQDGFDIRKTSANRTTIAKLTEPFLPGPSGRWDYGNKLKIKPVYGQFDAKSSLLVLNGANAVAVQTIEGQWELVQFTNATLEIDGTWTLSNLLRAQLGSDAQMSQTSAIGNHVVLLDQQIETIELSHLEKSLPTNWRIGPLVDAISEPSYHEQAFTFVDRAAMPFSPVHVVATRLPNDDLKISWTRRTRVYGDDWSAAEVPLGEALEAYRVNILNGSTIVRTMESSTTSLNYSAANQQSDFATLPSTVSLSVAQLDAFNNPGTWRETTLNL